MLGCRFSIVSKSTYQSTDGGDLKERRKFRRWDCVMPCLCEGEKMRLTGVIVNLSYGGAEIAGTKKLPELDTELLVAIRPRRENIELRSRVVWVASDVSQSELAQFGVKFLGRLSERRKKLACFFPKHYSVES